MSTISDVLATATIKNNMILPKQLEYWRQRLFVNGTHTDDQIKQYLDDILSSTTIKRACCLNGADKKKINVRIPIPKNLSLEGLPQINKDFGYIDKIIEIPSGLCNSLKTSSGKDKYVKPDKSDTNYNKPCDDFFDVYCSNMLTLYNGEYKSIYPNSTPNYDKFVNEYRPECACYNPNSTLASIKLPYGPRCLMYPKCTNANYDNGITYLDPLSREKCPDNLTICNQVIDLSNARAGGNINISPELQNTCGSSSSQSSSSSTIKTDDTKTNETSSTTNNTNVNEETNYVISEWYNDLYKNMYDKYVNTSETEDGKPNYVFYGTIAIIILIILCMCSSSSYFLISNKRK